MHTVTATTHSYAQPASDPTAVMGRRIGAYIVDFVIAMALFLAVFLLTADSQTMTGTSCPSTLDNAICVDLGDTTYFYETQNMWASYLVGFAYGVLVFWILQGLTGRTPGKLVFGVRTVDEAGGPPGIGKAFLRWILWIVDGLCFGIVALIAAFTSKGHRRIGDMVAKTFVVRGSHRGQVAIAGLNAGVQTGAAYQPPPQGGQPMPGQAPAQPQWDEARQMWVQWDPNGNRWMRFDQASNQWQPLA